MEKMNNEYFKKLSNDGVIFMSYDGVIINETSKIGSGTVIYPGTIIKENCTIGDNCTIGPNSLIENCIIGNNVTLNSSQAYSSSIGDNVTVGPFAHIRPNSTILDNAKIGNFVEIKNSVIGRFTSVAHLTYVGDSDVGEHVNFGCGCVTVNYDGKNKSRCVIGNHSFIGCNTNLVAPVKVGDHSYIAAGSTITDNVNDEAMAIARARQINKEGYASGRYKKK